MASQGRSHRDAFEFFRPGLDLQVELELWRRDDPAGLRSGFDADDLYDDVRPTFSRLQGMGKGVVVAGNQPVEARAALEAMDLGADRILISAELGFEKPSPGFFEKVSEALGVKAGDILYVGDRVDNDVLPAKASGMRTALIRRGPWGYLQAEWPQAAQADAIIYRLSEIPELLR